MRCDAMVQLQETAGRSWSEWKDNNTVNALSHWMELLDWIDGWIVSSADGLPLKSSSVGLCDAFYRARVHLQWHGQQVHRQILFTTVLVYLTDLWATCTASLPLPPSRSLIHSPATDRIGSDRIYWWRTQKNWEQHYTKTCWTFAFHYHRHRHFVEEGVGGMRTGLYKYNKG